MSSVSKRSWLGNVCILWWRGQYILWSVVLAGVAINLVSSWLTTKQWDVSGTPFGWLLVHPIILVVGSVLLILQTIGAFLIHRWEVLRSILGVFATATERASRLAGLW